ncbi:MAG: acetyl-CoA acetyltransferase [Thermodesulfobacteriota bacterium]|nr:acetyl-CoA acetyltransferase [Thermodesulfobacteriota bacterium]
MAESFKDKVAIIGMGCSKFGENWDLGSEDMIVDATYNALEDAGIEMKDIDAAWVGTIGFHGTGAGMTSTGITGAAISMPLKLQYKPVTHVENGCATGTDALRNAAFAVAAKVYDIVLVVGVEKLKDTGFGGLGELAIPPHPVFEGGITAPGMYALAATRYFKKYGLSPEEGKKMLAEVSVKSHYNASRNPRAHLRKAITEEQVLNAPIIAWPLGLFDCCGVTDGAAVAILCRAEDAKNFRDDYVLIKGLGLSIGPGQGSVRTDYDFTIWDETVYASKEAYTMAGITNPRKEIDLVECHDCFSISEIIAVESMGLCERGKALDDLNSGAWTQEGEIPVNLSGGLKAFGHPIGASGCREAFEVYKQLQGKAEDKSRQLKNPKIGLVHNQAGLPGKFMCAVALYGLPV